MLAAGKTLDSSVSGRSLRGARFPALEIQPESSIHLLRRVEPRRHIRIQHDDVRAFLQSLEILSADALGEVVPSEYFIFGIRLASHGFVARVSLRSLR